jgi:hypothetical protein
MRRRLPASIVALASACAVLAGCSTDSGVNAQTLESTEPATSVSLTAQSLPSSASSPVPVSSPAASTTAAAATDGGLSAQETADRAAVEAQWVKSWDVLLGIARTPAPDREALAATVAVDPIKAKMLEAATALDSQSLDTYGALGHRISWPQPINGGTNAVIDDCQDRSQAGSLNTATGDKVTVGVPRDHYQGSLVKGDDGIWRVAQVYYLKDEPC